jgi:hypothetical protein
MLVGGYDAVHFYSYFPGWPSVAIVTERDPVFIGMLERELNHFLAKMDKAIDRLQKNGLLPVKRSPKPGAVPLQSIVPGIN